MSLTNQHEHNAVASASAQPHELIAWADDDFFRREEAQSAISAERTASAESLKTIDPLASCTYNFDAKDFARSLREQFGLGESNDGVVNDFEMRMFAAGGLNHARKVAQVPQVNFEPSVNVFHSSEPELRREYEARQRMLFNNMFVTSI